MQTQVQKRLNKLYQDRLNIEKEIALLEKKLIKKELNKDEKIELFRSLFISRADVYLKKWVSKDSTKESYFPVTKTFQGEDYLPLLNNDIEQHLRGKVQLSTYNISISNQCKYAVLKITKNDISKLQSTLNDLNIIGNYQFDSYNDILVWFFFEESIAAKDTKEFLQNIMKNATISAKIYPNSDFVNSGNFGTFVELPLHLKLRENNKTIFFDPNNLNIFNDQWDFLLNINKIEKSKILNISKSNAEKKLQSWENQNQNSIEYPNFTLNITIFDFIYISTKNLSKSFLNELKNLAVFDNPQIKILLSLRKPLFNTPKQIKNYEEDESYLKLPRGVLGFVLKILKQNGVKYTLDDKRVEIKEEFPKIKFELREEQNLAISKVIKKDFSICVAPPGFGKTLIGAKMIEQRGVNTLIIVNKNMLLDQWIQRFVDYFGMNKKDIGFLGKSKNKLTGKLDIATMQSLKNQPELIKKYSFVIVDECHHIPAVTFEQIIKLFCGKYVLGLSATPNRKDGLEPILFQQLGQTSYEYKKKRTITHRVKVVNTDFKSQADNYAQLINEITIDKYRNELIINEVKQYINRKILILTDRIEHINILEELLIKNNLNYVSIHGSLSKKEQQENLEQIENSNLILATTSYFGEGIDFPHLNTIIFVTPISYYGRLVQYLGRVGRDGQECLAIDLLDSKNAMLNSTFKKRLEGYKQMHYKIY
jgi:superfamily II DNA or RNA helicase